MRATPRNTPRSTSRRGQHRLASGSGARAELPKDRMVVMYCNSGSLSAQAVFALRLLGYDNVKVLQDGIEAGKPRALRRHARASKPAGH